VAEAQTRPRSQGEVGRPAEEEVRVSGNVATSSWDGGEVVSSVRPCDLLLVNRPRARSSDLRSITSYYMYTHTHTHDYDATGATWDDLTFFRSHPPSPLPPTLIRSSSSRRRCMCSYLRRPPYNNIILLYTQPPIHNILYNYIIQYTRTV